MHPHWTPTALLLALLLTACGGAAARPTTAPVPVPAPAANLMALTAQHKLAPEELRAALEAYVNQGDGSVTDRLTALYEHWGLKARPDAVPYVEADLRGDGKTEVVTTAKDPNPLNGAGAVFVIYKQGNRYAVDRTPRTDLPGVSLHGVAPITGDARRQIVWSATALAANSPPTRFFVSGWEPGKLAALPGSGDPLMVYPQVKLEGRDLVLHGGMMGSAGSGVAQRPRTDRWRWEGGALRLVDRSLDPRVEAYFRLQDGMIDEGFGRLAPAETAYRDALDPDRTPPPDTFFRSERGASIDFAAARARLDRAVRSFARLRLGLLLLDRGDIASAAALLKADPGPFAGLPMALAETGERKAGCSTAQAWARANPDFLAALNSPFGFAKVTWEPKDLCGPLPLPFLDSPNPPR